MSRTTTATRREIACQLIVRRDAALAREAGRDAVAAQAPYTYAELAAAHRAGALVELLGALDSYTLRAQAVAFEVETGGRWRADEVERRWCRSLSAARFGRAEG